MSQTLAKLSLVLCSLGLLAQPCRSSAQTGPTVKVVISDSPKSVTDGDPIKGSVLITLAGFSKPVNVTVLGGLANNYKGDFADVPRAVVLHSRPNGSYRLSLSGDLDMRATYKSVPDEVCVSAIVNTGGRRLKGDDRKPIDVQDAQEDLRFAGVSLNPAEGRLYTFPLNVPQKVILGYSVFRRGPELISGNVKETVRISGPLDKSFPVRSHRLDRANDGYEIRSVYDFTFTKSGEYRVEYELSIGGGKTLKGREILFVPGLVDLKLVSASPRLDNDMKVTAGVPFDFLVKYVVNNVTENQFDIVESLEFSGPEKVSISPKRRLEGPGDPTWESLYEVKLVKPGSYKWKVVLSPQRGQKLESDIGALTVTSPVSGGGGKVWTRGEGVNDIQYLQDLKLGTNSVSWTALNRDGKSAASTLTWTEPPSTLTEGQAVAMMIGFVPWSGPSFEARIFSYAFEGGRNNILSASANNSTRLTAERTFIFKGPQPGEPQDQATIVLQVNYRAGDFSETPSNRLYRSWIYRKGGVADLGVGGIKDKTQMIAGPSSYAPHLLESVR